jgi:hypothetical protein
MQKHGQTNKQANKQTTATDVVALAEVIATKKRI